MGPPRPILAPVLHGLAGLGQSTRVDMTRVRV